MMDPEAASQSQLIFDEQTLARLERIKSHPPLFIVGCPRSGTTLLMRLVRDYLDVGFGRDNSRFLDFEQRLDQYGDLEDDERMHRLMRDIFADRDFQRRFEYMKLDPKQFSLALGTRTYPELVKTIYAVFALVQGKARWGDKTPQYVLHLDELAALFPDAKFIHMIRDGRDVALSLFRMPWGAPRNCYVAAHYWKKRVSAGQAYGAQLGRDRYLEVIYEHLLDDPELVFERVLDFGCFGVDRTEVITRFRGDAGRILRRDNYGKWKASMTDSEVQVFEQVAGDKLLEFGYEVRFPGQVGRGVGLSNKVYWHAQNLLTRIFKEGAGNIPQFIRRRMNRAR